MNKENYENSAIELMKEAFENIVTYDEKPYKGRGKVWNSHKPQELTAEFAIKGLKYGSISNRLMVVGRAVGVLNPSDVKVMLKKNEIVNEQSLLQRSRELFEDFSKRDLEWVTENPNKKGAQRISEKPFFKIVREVLVKLNPTLQVENDWAEYIIRSNLYKITFVDGNKPNVALIRAQTEAMSELLYSEIVEYKPTHILFITGNSELSAAFQDQINNAKKQVNFEYAVINRPETRKKNNKAEIYKEINSQFNVDL